MLTGAVGQIQWGYYLAAQVHAYAVARDAVSRRWSLTGTVVLPNAYNLAQRPLFFVVPRAKGDAWRWPIQALTLTDGRLAATLDPPV